jgi:hypothetical protein
MTGKKKKVDFSVRPRAIQESLPADADQWVQGGGGASSPPQKPHPLKQKRLTLNLPASQHTAFKGRCVLEGVTIQDKVQTLIDAYLSTGESRIAISQDG